MYKSKTDLANPENGSQNNNLNDLVHLVLTTILVGIVTSTVGQLE